MLDSVEISGGGITTFRARKYVYNTALGTLTTIRLAGAGTALAYNKDGQDTSITFPGGDKIRQLQYLLHGFTQRATAAAYNNSIARSVSYDSAGRIKEQVTGNGSTGRRYRYDGLSRLVADSTIQNNSPPLSCGGIPIPTLNLFGNSCFDTGSWPPTGGVQFAYDQVGNRTDQGGSYGSANRIRTFAGCTYVTDSLGDGNVLSRTCGSEIATFSWSAESRLTSVAVGGYTSTFFYDAAGRLERQDVNGWPVAHFLWDGANLDAELGPAATTLVAQYSYYPGLDNPHATIVGGTQYNAHADGLGNTIALTDGAPSVKRTYAFDAWGQLTGGSDTRPFNNSDRVRWKGAMWLGPYSDLYYMRARWYEPKSGRFLSEDPTTLEGGINPYTYAGNDPINGSDPSGLECVAVYEWIEVENTATGEVKGEWQFMHWECTGNLSNSRGPSTRNLPPLSLGPPRGSRVRGPQLRPTSDLVGDQCRASVATFLMSGTLDALTLVGGAGVLLRGAVAYRAGTRYVTRALANPFARYNAAAARRAVGAGLRDVASGPLGGVTTLVPNGAIGEVMTGSSFNVLDYLPLIGTWRAYQQMNRACG